MTIEFIWSEYQNNLRNFLRRHISNPADVDDLLQEILIKYHRNLSKLEDKNKLKSWLFQIASNTVTDFYRKNHSKVQHAALEEWEGLSESSTISELAQCIVPFINSLPKEKAALLTAIEIEGVSQKDYAKSIGVNYSTIKSRVQKSRQSLFKIFQHCCSFEVSSKGNIIDFERKSKGCSKC